MQLVYVLFVEASYRQSGVFTIHAAARLSSSVEIRSLIIGKNFLLSGLSISPSARPSSQRTRLD
jgi:hypothetical protein